MTWRCGLLFVALLVGCSSSDRVAVHRVEGQVFLNDNPATGATVKFIAITPTEETRRLRPMGVVDADGTFRLATYEAGDGAPLGEYIVLVTWPTPDDLTDPAEIPEDWEGLRHRYGDRANSPLRATVKKGNNRLSPFRLP